MTPHGTPPRLHIFYRCFLLLHTVLPGPGLFPTLLLSWQSHIPLSRHFLPPSHGLQPCYYCLTGAHPLPSPALLVSFGSPTLLRLCLRLLISHLFSVFHLSSCASSGFSTYPLRPMCHLLSHLQRIFGFCHTRPNLFATLGSQRLPVGVFHAFFRHLLHFGVAGLCLRAARFLHLRATTLSLFLLLLLSVPYIQQH